MVCSLTAISAGLSACGSAEPKYGALPSWLPKSTLAVHRVVEASAAQPQLGIEGDTIKVKVPEGQVMATMVGPSDTTEGRYPPPETTPCTFILTLADASGAVPINPADFTILDEDGNVYHPEVAVDGAPPPAAVRAGNPVGLRITDVLPTGSGELRWAAGSGTAIASWDYSVEID